MGCTIYDIAQDTGYSIATISRVINNQGLVKPKTRDKILEAIARMGYEPSMMAQGLASNTSHTIGLAVGALSGAAGHANYALLLMSGIVSAAGKRGYAVLVEIQNMLEPPIVRRRYVDGIIFSGVTNQFDEVRGLLSKDFPFVYIGIQQPFDDIGRNIYGGYHLYKQEMLDILYQRGYRNIVMYERGMDKRDPILAGEFYKTIAAFNAQTGPNPAQCRLVEYDTDYGESFKEAFCKLLTSPDRPDAICLDTSQLYAPIYEVLQQMKIRVPQDLGIVMTSHKKSEELNFFQPVTCIYLDAFEMGRRCADLLINQIEKCDEQIDRYVPYQFIERGSIRPCP